jgi:hypothetical protein
MSTNFLSLPSELRNKIYEQLVVHQEPINPCILYNGRYGLTPGLLRVNKTVHREATSLLYAQNCFDLTRFTFGDIPSFLEQIGRNNAAYIRHIYINFPSFLYLDPSDITLKDKSDHILAKIQSECANLSTLKTSLDSTNTMELRLDRLDYPKVVVEALSLVNTRFRAISSLQEIIVEVYKDGPSDHIRREMKRHGWTVIENEYVEYVEEEDFDISFSDIYFADYDDFRLDYDDMNDDDYDIDNDSDYWRRAGD